MADEATSKIDAAAEKAYAEAAAKTVEAKNAAAPVITAQAVASPAAAPKVAAKPAGTKKVAAKPAAKKAVVRKMVAKKPAVKNLADKKSAAKPAPRRAAAKPVTAPKIASPQSISKETIMTKAKETATDYAAQLKSGLTDLQARAKTAYEKSSEIASEMGEFSKHNVEAVVEAGKILASGMQEMAKSYVEEGKAAVSTMTADAKEVAAVKSPTEFVQLQGKIASRNFDATVATLSKTTEAWVKLAGEAFAPISSRVSVAMDKVKKAA